ncbi:unnamed protein product [Symbiodinium sp. CCMP2592]|nr:unnamed protein product [Symbiodinium sp. CCMP2592]
MPFMEGTAEQNLQRRTNMTNKLAKRLAGNARAKADLGISLQQWFLQLGQHAAGLLSQVRAIGQRLDADTEVAAGEMRDILAGQPSESTSAQVDRALAALGPVWGPLQEAEVLQIAARLRAFGATPAIGAPSTEAPSGVAPPSFASGAVMSFTRPEQTSPGSEASFGPVGLGQSGTAVRELDYGGRGRLMDGEDFAVFDGFPDLLGRSGTTTVDSESMGGDGGPSGCGRGGRWRKRSGVIPDRPSKSPRREAPAEPWRTAATGLTPEAVPRVPQTTVVENDVELATEETGPPAAELSSPATRPTALTWTQAWLYMLKFAADNGDAVIGEVATSDTQDLAMPLPKDGLEPAAVVAAADKVWQELVQLLREPGTTSDLLASLYHSLAQILHHIRSSPGALSQVRQGLVVAAQISAGNLLDPFSYAPATAQEWLFPNMLIERADTVCTYRFTRWGLLSWFLGLVGYCLAPWLLVVRLLELKLLRGKGDTAFAPTKVLNTYPGSADHHIAPDRGTPCCEPRARSRPPLISQKMRRQGKVLGLLWLLCSPVQAVQVWPVRRFGEHTVYATGSVPDTRAVSDLAPASVAGTPCMVPALQQSPTALRDIAVFAPQADACPVVLQVDERVHGALLFRWIGVALGFRADYWLFRRQIELLPSLPPEQYVVSAWSQAWHQISIPVDLRPLGGRIALADVHRNQPCGRVVQVIAQAQGCLLPQHLLCRVGGHWFEPAAYTMLLPGGDALQAWPAENIPRAAFPQRPGSLSPRLSLEDVFSASLSLPSTDESAFHHASGHNAVIITPFGLQYVHTPHFAAAEDIRISALHGVLGSVSDGDPFLRILPPLAHLPAVQFVTLPSRAERQPTVLDLRPVGGGIHVVACDSGDSPEVRLRTGVDAYGAPLVGEAILHEQEQGRLLFLHQERQVAPDMPLHVEGAVVLVVLPLSTVSVESEGSERSAGRFAQVWAVRIGEWVKAACTNTVEWQHVMTLGGLTSWDLPGVAVHGADQIWSWPAELADFSGQCGHLLQDGRDPFVCDVHRGVLFQLGAARNASGSHVAAGATALAARTFRASWILSLSLLFAFPMAVSAMPTMPHTSDEDEWEEPAVVPQYNATPTCNFGWSHELSCQTTLCGVHIEALHHHCQVASPFEVVRIAVWTPFMGPSFFDFPRDGPLHAFRFLLREAGYHEEACSLHIAFDTLPTSLELVACPQGPQRWWIVRDGMARELLRPVRPWLEADGRRILTVNSHGQGQGLSYSEEAGRMHLLPNGVRAAITYPFSRVTGRLFEGCLELLEHNIGVPSVVAAAALSGRSSWSVLLGLVVSVQAMQNDLALRSATVTAPVHSDWAPHRPQLVPSLTRIWTATLAAPTVVSYHECPDPVAMASSVANTARGLAPVGDFVWTTPRVVHGVAHILQVPPCSAPPLTYWLLHFRGRAVVISSPRQNFDWQHIAQVASEEFGHAFFAQGHFAVWHGGRTISFNTQIPAPAHGTIVTLVRTTPASSVGLSAWDTPADLPMTHHFEYDICRGPGGEVPLPGELCAHMGPHGLLGTSTNRRNAVDTTSGQALTPAPALVRQINEVSHQLILLTTRLESAGVLPQQEAAASIEAPNFRGDAAQAAQVAQASGHDEPHSGGRGILPMLTCLGSLFSVSTRAPILCLCLVLRAVANGDTDNTGSSEEEQEPSSPDLSGVAPPTPGGELLGPDHQGGALLRPSDEPGASTSVPSEAAPPPASLFQPATIPLLQHRVTAYLQEVGEPGHAPRPFLPEGCPLTVHNPFTRNAQCPVLSPLIGTGFAFRLFLQDYSGRRGWQPIVPVQPQPDERAIHLIPAAADPSLVSVLLRTPDRLHPICLPRVLPVGPSRSITLAGRFGRLREPYPVRRLADRPVYLRDGDCLQLDQGPFGPPPPTPARSGAHSVSPLM